MNDFMEKVYELNEMKKTFTCWAKEEIGKGKTCIDTHEMGEVIDMIKDLSEAEKNCLKAYYYKTIVEAMEGGETDDRYGYDHYRYSSGRFAPKGHGHVTGFVPPDMMEDYRDLQRMGYVDDSRSHEPRESDRYGYSYGRYMDSRRHFHESGSPKDKEDMDKHAKEHMAGAIMTMRDIWGEADPEMKKKMKTDLMALLNEMNT